MNIVSIKSEDLDDYGLVSFQWIVRDPENTRYIKGHSNAFLIQMQHHTVGFMMQRPLQNKLYIDYLIFDSTIHQNQIRQLFEKHLSPRPAHITTYDRNSCDSIWKKMGWNIELGQQFLECPIANLLKTPPTAIEIELLHWEKDFQKMFDVYQHSFPKEEWDIFKNSREDPFCKKATIFLAKKHGAIVGLWVHVTYFQNQCFLCWLGILPEYRRQGIATAMLYHGARQAMKEKCEKMTLLVRPDNKAAIALYERLGFVKAWQRIHLHKE